MLFSSRSICYCGNDNKVTRFSSSYIPNDMEVKITLLTYFSNYMDKHLLKVIVFIDLIYYVLNHKNWS